MRLRLRLGLLGALRSSLTLAACGGDAVALSSDDGSTLVVGTGGEARTRPAIVHPASRARLR